MGVANDLALAVELLGSAVVGACGVGEGTELHVLNQDLNLESGVGLDDLEVLGVQNNGGHHVVDAGDVTHGYTEVRNQVVCEPLAHDSLTNTVARSASVLETVGQGLAVTLVDEVGLVTVARLV